MVLVNASISIKQIITINREFELYLKINKILTVIIITKHPQHCKSNQNTPTLLTLIVLPCFNSSLRLTKISPYYKLGNNYFLIICVLNKGKFQFFQFF